MIKFSALRQYTQVVNGVMYGQNVKEPFLIIYFPENTNLINDFSIMNIRQVDFRIVTVPLTTVPRTRLTPDLVKAYRGVRLIPYSLNQKIPTGKNVILDLSQYVNSIDMMYKPTNYRQRAGFLLKNILTTAANSFPNNYQKILMYSVNLNNDLNQFINRKIFTFLKDMKAGEFGFNDMILNTIVDGESSYRLLVKDEEYKFPRILPYIKKLKGIQTGVEQQEDIDKASNIIMKSLDKNLTPQNKGKIRAAIDGYL
jgi:hypothetical protein